MARAPGVALGLPRVLALALAVVARQAVGALGSVAAEGGAEDAAALIHREASGDELDEEATLQANVMLLQTGLQHPRHRGAEVYAQQSGAATAASESRWGLFSNFSRTANNKAAAAAHPVFTADDCAKHPKLCQPPFNCNKPSSMSDGEQAAKGLAPDGKVNYQSWCNSPNYGPYISRCLAGNLDGAGRRLAELTRAGTFGPHTSELDASYCFIDGLCVNTDVTNQTTVDESLQLCDKRFGREKWSRAGDASFMANFVAQLKSNADPANGFTSRAQTEPFLLLACAMGNYHCDVRYCQVTYCKDEYYAHKYGHFLKDFGWVK